MIYSAVFLPCLRIAFIGTLLIFFGSWFVKKLLCFIRAWRKPYECDEDEGNNSQKEAEYSARQNVWKQNVQDLYCEKAAKYKEEIQIPRQKEKRERKEKEFYKLLGPAWKGEGNTLGGEDDSSSDTNEIDNRPTNENTRAARRRKIPEPEPSTAVRMAKPKPKPKRVIELPEEPSESDPEAVLVIMRTPISTVVRRRFRFDHSFQNVLDFMTKSGFSQLHHQLCTSYPRCVLSPDPEVPLSDLGFGKRVTLNIEDKEDSDDS